MDPSEVFTVYLKDLGSASVGAFLAVSGSEEVRSTLGFLRAVLIIASLVLALLITWLVRKANLIDGWKRKYYQWYRPSEPEKKIKKLGETWQVIGNLVESSFDQRSYRRAVLAADTVLYAVLNQFSFVGETVAEKLHHVTPAEIRNLGQLIQAHKTVATLRENTRAEVSQDRAQEIIKVYTSALQDLGSLTRPMG